MPATIVTGTMKYKDSQGQYQEITGLRGSQGPRGDQGPRGETGPKGDPGVESVLTAVQITGNQYRLGLERM